MNHLGSVCLPVQLWNRAIGKIVSALSRYKLSKGKRRETSASGLYLEGAPKKHFNINLMENLDVLQGKLQIWRLEESGLRALIMLIEPTKWGLWQARTAKEVCFHFDVDIADRCLIQNRSWSSLSKQERPEIGEGYRGWFVKMFGHCKGSSKKLECSSK